MPDIAPEYTPASQLSHLSKLAKLEQMYLEQEDLERCIAVAEAELFIDPRPWVRRDQQRRDRQR